MPYIGQQPTNVAFLTDQFSGNGSTTAFTLSAAPANTSSILVAISGVLQDPSTYSVSGTTLTFSPAPPSGTGNISVRFLGIPASGVTTTAYRTVTEFTATAGQTTFSVPSYTPGFIDVYRNGVLLGSADYTATNGVSVVLVNACTVGDLVEVISFQVSSVLNAVQPTGTTFSGNVLFASGNGIWNTSGNVGIGTSSPATKLELNTASSYGGLRIKGTSSASNGFEMALSSDGVTGNFWLYENAPMRFATNSTERMRIDSSGNVGIGTSSPGVQLDLSRAAGSTTQLRVKNTSSTSQASTLQCLNDTDTNINMGVFGSAAGTVGMVGANSPFISTSATELNLIANNASGVMKFATGGLTERMRIDSSGRIGINSAPAAWIGNEQLYVAGTSSLNNQFVGNIAVGSSSPSGACSLFLNYTAAAPNNTSNSYLICNDNSGVQKLNIYSNGTVSNRTGTYNSLSDLKLKENIVDATPKLDKLMQTKVRNYNLIGDELKQIGFVAQELEQVFPGLVEDVPDFDENQQPTGEVTKMVKTSVLVPILVKAMQEQQQIIEDLKARIEVLEAK